MNFTWFRTCLAGAGFLALAALATASAPGTGISLEREVSMTLDRGDYRPLPMDDRTPLILRLEKVTPTEDGRFTYEFRYLGFEPGAHRLADYLIEPDGSPATALGESLIQVDSVLPDDHLGQLNQFATQPIPSTGGYRMALGGLLLLWLCALPALIWVGRKKKDFAPAEAVPPVPTYAERMRPLVEAAAAGQLSAADQATLERLMTGYWREKIATPELRMADALSLLRSHGEAGELLKALEDWLHRPGGTSGAEIAGLLEPFRAPPANLTQEAEA